MTNKDIEVRRLKPGQINDLARILDDHDAWKRLMSCITTTSPENENMDFKYSTSDIGAIEQAGLSGRLGTCTEIFMSEWGTSGKERPTVRVLLRFLLAAKLLRAAEYVSEKLLNEPLSMHTTEPVLEEFLNSEIIRSSFSDLPTVQCADETSEEFSMRFCVEGSNTLQREFIQEKIENVNVINFDAVKTCTRNFDKKNILGSGGFGIVYSGVLEGENVAIKKLNVYDRNSDLRKQFKNELIALSQCCDHPNIVPLKAVSYNEVPCLIYELMPNGSLDKRLTCQLENFPPMSWQKRVCVANDISSGLKYLHTAQFIHRDIKSANILLDSNDVARIGDFGLVRKHESLKTTSTSVLRGTEAYMAREAFNGTISVKMDVFSYGVVLLELLTGLLAYDSNREGQESLVDYIQEEADESEKFINFLDKKAGSWHVDIWKGMYDLYKNCTANYKKDRPEMHVVDEAMSNFRKNVSQTVG